jgi:hypothetical protein
MAECALWYYYNHTVTYEICTDEADAAEHAVYLQEYGEGMPIGVQFPDGRLAKMNTWPVYLKTYRAYQAVLNAERAELAAQPKVETRQILDPFDGKPVKVAVDEPAWLGRQDVNAE